MAEDASHLIHACYGALRHCGLFRTPLPDVERGALCVLRTERGVELGSAICDAFPGPRDLGREPDGELLRLAGPEDEAKAVELTTRAGEEDFAFCEARITERELPMRLVHVESLLGGGKIVFYFVSDGRVDFRELVKDLARHFRTRIELRQIGVRDEAKILGDFEYCGRELCCLTWMQEILPVTMRMAKNQKSTLDPNKISGRCGRLKCCLRFEDEVYTELRGRMPRVGKLVMTDRGVAKVLAVDAMAATATLQLESRERFQVAVGEVRPYEPHPPETTDAKGVAEKDGEDSRSGEGSV